MLEGISQACSPVHISDYLYMFALSSYCQNITEGQITFYFCCRFFLTGSQKRFFEKLSIYCDRYAEQIPVTFVLGKYRLNVKLFSSSFSVQAFCECWCMEAFQSWGACGRLEVHNKSSTSDTSDRSPQVQVAFVTSTFMLVFLIY